MFTKNKVQKFGINLNIGNLKIIEITPVLLENKKWHIIGFEDSKQNSGDMIHLALLYIKNFKNVPFDLVAHFRDIYLQQTPMVRVHSECLLGDSFSSTLCDCGTQLKHSIKSIVKNESGIILYLRQEGRGIGLRAKLSALSAQEGYIGGKKISKYYSPDEANILLGYDVDCRDYSIVPLILNFLGAKNIILLTGNPDKIRLFENVKIKSRVAPCIDFSKIRLNARQKLELKEKLNRKYLYKI